MKRFLLLSSLLLLSACYRSSGTRINSIYAPNNPIDLSKITKVGKSCYLSYYGSYNRGPTPYAGDNRIIEAAKNGGITKIHLIEMGNEPTGSYYSTLYCTYVYGE